MKKFRLVLSLALTAAVLPLFLFAVVSRQQLLTFVQASPTDQLRLWFEPSEVVMRKGQSISINVIGEYVGEDRIIPSVKSVITYSSGLKVKSGNFEYSTGFSGRKKLGNVEIMAFENGTQKLMMDEKNVFTNLPDLPIVTAEAKIIVK